MDLQYMHDKNGKKLSSMDMESISCSFCKLVLKHLVQLIRCILATLIKKYNSKYPLLNLILAYTINRKDTATCSLTSLLCSYKTCIVGSKAVV